MANPFTFGDLVISIYGRGQPGDTTTYTDNQASPITLEDISTSGVVGGTLVLPQTTSVSNGVTQYAVSGEYGSSSEGSLSLSGDGRSLVIAGYAVNAATYNAGGAAVYGDARLAQSTSVPGGKYTPVQRVIADVRADGSVDSSTALYNVANGNNPRSAVTENGSSFYLSGQGQSGDKTQGVFAVADGAASATAIDTSTDTRSLALSNGVLYVSRDSKQPKGTGTSNVASYGGEPTAATAPTPLPGLSSNVTLAQGQGNAINQSSGTVNLSPENIYFANSTTLYVADAGLPKQGGVGDGGLQKWTFGGGKWSLAYTLSSGLSLVNGTSASAGTTGLIGLAGKTNADGTVSLFATNATIGDLDQTYLYGINDRLAAGALPTDESFTTLATAAPNTNIRGVALAPLCFATGTRIATARGEIAVEALRVGDRVRTSSGMLRPIRWIGHRSMRPAAHPEPWTVHPVRVCAGAFGSGLPHRDLFLSPGHPVLIGDDANARLVPIMCLVNGTTIERVAVDEVTYWHVELDGHDVLLAEGLPAESYLDCGDRAFFTDRPYEALGDPDFIVPGLGARCVPVAVDGSLVAAERRRLDTVFAAKLAAMSAWPSADASAA